jgi:hypothetical protein
MVWKMRSLERAALTVDEPRLMSTSLTMTDLTKRTAARRRRLADFPGEGMPPAGMTCQLLCEDHVGTYTLPYLCHWSDGTWRNVITQEPVKTGVVGWRVKSAGFGNGPD